MKILINCTGKFCYRHGNFQKTEAARGVFKSLTKFTRKHLWRVWCTPGLWSATLLKKRLRHRCFSVNFVKSLRTPFLQATVSQNMKAYI